VDIVRLPVIDLRDGEERGRREQRKLETNMVEAGVRAVGVVCR